MSRYDRQHDYGLRGARDWNVQFSRSAGRPRYDRGYEHQGIAPAARPNRVTARYNMDYVVGNQGPRYPRNPYGYAGDREERVGDAFSYRQPYMTQGGTRTWRGSGPVRAPRGFTPADRGLDDYDRDFGLGGRGRYR